MRGEAFTLIRNPHNLYSWAVKGREHWAEFCSFDLLAHDILDHQVTDTGSVFQELHALGASISSRKEMSNGAIHPLFFDKLIDMLRMEQHKDRFGFIRRYQSVLPREQVSNYLERSIELISNDEFNWGIKNSSVQWAEGNRRFLRKAIQYGMDQNVARWERSGASISWAHLRDWFIGNLKKIDESILEVSIQLQGNEISFVSVRGESNV